MNIMDVKKQIHDKSLSNLYIFYGDEYTILEEYIKMIKALFKNVMICESISDVYSNLCAKSLLFDAKGTLYVIRDDKEFQSNQKYWKDLEKLLSKNGCTMLFKYSSIQKTSQFYKRFENSLVLFDKLSDQIIKKYMKKEMELPDNYYDFLLQVCDSDYGRIKLELDKVRNLSEYTGMSYDKAFKSIVDAGLIHCELTGDATELANCIMERNVKDVSYYLEQSTLRGDNPLFVLSLIHNLAKCTLQLKLIGNVKDISAMTGLNGYQIKNCQQFVGKYTEKELVRIVKLVKYCDDSIKNGVMNPEIVVPYLIVNVM